jgi:hypothetical protein
MGGVMKIAVLIASRGRPFRLGVALQRIFDTADNPENITVSVWLDDDDKTPSLDVVRGFMGGRVTVTVGSRPQSLGEAHNALSTKVDADLYCVLADDVYPQSRGWDSMLVSAHAQHNQPVYCWLHRSEDPAYPILTKKWVQAAGGVFTADLFPFWFDDFWLAEIVEIATGEPIACLTGLKLTGDKGTGTPRMRDLAYWYSVFHKTRPLRVEEAKNIYRNLNGYEMPDRSEIVASLAEKDAWREEMAPKWQEAYSTAKGEPDAGYVKAKEKSTDVVKRIS